MTSRDFPELDTPALIIDLDIMEQNIERMATLTRQHKVALRPHIKTHKSPWIARQQIAAGAVGVTAAKLSEAEVMVEGGVEDVLIAFPLVGEAKLRRLERLAYDAKRLALSLDAMEVAEGIAGVGRRLGKPFPVYLEVDTGLARVGVASGDPAVKFAEALAKLEGITLQAVMTHGGHVGATASREALASAGRDQAARLVDTAERIRAHGIPVETVSPGSTLAAPYEVTTEGVTEVRPGTYVFNDVNTVTRWTANLDQCAASILATVISHPTKDRAVVDAGTKSFGADRRVDGSPEPAYVRSHEHVRLVRASEEHGVLHLEAGAELAIGERVEIVMNHVCPVINLYDMMIGVRGNKVELEIPVTARGCRT